MAGLIIITSIRVSGNDKKILKRIGRIEVCFIDTINGYDTTFVMPDENISDIFATKLDSLTNSWHINNSYTFDQPADTTPLNIKLNDTLYINRLKEIDAVVNLSFNNTVRNIIELYTQRRREQVEIMLGASAYYFPIIEEILDRFNLPLELKYLPVIESAFNPIYWIN